VKFNFFNGREVKRAILHQHTKFRTDRSNHYRDITIFVIFQDGSRRYLGFSEIENFNCRSAAGGKYASSRKISSKSVQRSQIYGDLMGFLKMAAVHHLGFVKFKFFNGR